MPMSGRMLTKHTRSSALSITSVDEVPGFEDYISPLAVLEDESSFGESNTGSVTSEAIDQLLASIEDTQKELKAAELEEDGVEKEHRMKQLVERLSEAAEALRKMER
jgi:hypothetical protein